MSNTAYEFYQIDIKVGDKVKVETVGEGMIGTVLIIEKIYPEAGSLHPLYGHEKAIVRLKNGYVLREVMPFEVTKI